MEDTIDAFERLVPIASLLDKSTTQYPTAVIPLCDRCIQYREQLEELIRDQVISEIFSRKRNLRQDSSNSLSSAIHLTLKDYMKTTGNPIENLDVDNIVHAYDEENRELLVELAKQKKMVQELSEKLGEH